VTVNVKIVERDGTVVTTFDADEGDGDTREKATVTEVAWVLNQPGSARLVLPLFHPATLDVLFAQREIQIFRDDEIIWWGVPVQARRAGAAWDVVCAGLAWYFSRLHFGPIQVQYLTNPLFETNLTGWTAVNTTATHETSMRIRGPGTAQLVQASAGQDAYLEQEFEVTTGADGLALFIAAWCWIDPASGFEPALDERGLMILATDSAQGTSWQPINRNTPQGQLVRLDTVINMDPGVTDSPVAVRLYSPKGTIRWGATTATVLESISSYPDGQDATEVMRRIVDYAQNGTGKTDLNIGTSTPASGINELVAYQFAELGQILQALQTYPERGIADFDVVYDETTRTFTTYAPQKGTDLSGSVVFTVPADGSVLQFGHLTDATQTATQVVRRFPGNGPTRELGIATDTSSLDGLLLQSIGDVPPEITVDGVNQYAQTELARLREVVTIPDFTVPAAEIFGVVEVGDTVGVDIDWGAIQETTPRRVYRLVWDPLADTVDVGVTQ
jgi:hypothetical protein